MKWSFSGAKAKAVVLLFAVVTSCVALLLFLFASALVQRTGRTRCLRTYPDVCGIQAACEEFFDVHGRYPTELDELVRPDAEGRTFLEGSRIRLDIWERPYVIVRPERARVESMVYSLERDGKLGGDGDDQDVSNLGRGDEAGLDRILRRSN